MKHQLFFLLVVLAAHVAGASPSEVLLKNPGFESTGPGGSLPEWSRGSGDAPPGMQLSTDSLVRHSGSRSYVMKHDRPATSLLASSPVMLQVGSLYRVSGWIKTDHAVSDPTSRYPTAVAATITMGSFPFTNHTPTVGGTTDWKKVEVLFIATQKVDFVRIHFGLNGTAVGTAWFDDLAVEEVDDITQYIPTETVRWFGPAFRYSDKGWTFVHIEGQPYRRGYQYGYLLSSEISSYIDKLALRGNPDNPKQGWSDLRTLADALMLRKYDEEFLLEMRGIADGAAKHGSTFGGRPVDFLDIVTLNSAVDLGQLSGALAKSPTPLSGRSFRAEEEEMNAPERLHKCSSFLANGPATKDGKIVFGQLFMWSGYTGVHWDIICDVVPSEGRRLVYQTFPGGIHSGSDFYINDAGIMIGETTVMQTPFNADGSPQSSRIRKAAQYAKSIDDVVHILTENNNGLYTNDWLIADVKANETAILLLGTRKFKLWRSGKGEFPGGTEGFLWSVNNAKDPEVRKEYVPDPTNAPFDVVFNSVNRDVAFVDYYRREKGKIDAISAVNLLGSSPINRPHACDGKVTTTEMAEHMVFLAHYGKVTLREKFPEKNSRLMPDLANAIPHLSLGYSVVSPVFVAEKLKQLREKTVHKEERKETNLSAVSDAYSFEKKLLWFNTVYPATEGDNWFTSATATYWSMLNSIPAGTQAALPVLQERLNELNCRLLYTLSREESISPVKAKRQYDGYAAYVVPRIRGTFLLHQLRLFLGNETFSRVMNTIHDRYNGKDLSTKEFIARAEEISGKELKSFVMQWLERNDLPRPEPHASVVQTPEGWTVKLDVTQSGQPYVFTTTLSIATAREVRWEKVLVTGSAGSYSFTLKDRPAHITFNAGGDIPVDRKSFYTLSNYFDDYRNSMIIYGTSREDEANHTLALRYQTVLADAFTEILAPARKESEVSAQERSSDDLVVLGGVADNAMAPALAGAAGIETGKNFFRWRGKTYADPDDAPFAAIPNPENAQRVVYLFLANSALQLHQMTKRYQPLPSWALFKGEQVAEKGYHTVEQFEIELPAGDVRGPMTH